MEALDCGSELEVTEAVKVMDLQILGKPFQIFQYSEAPEPILGFCETYLQKISVLKGLPTETEQETFLHEVIHAVEEQLSLGMTENQVYALACGLYAVYKNNLKPLRNYLKNGFRSATTQA